MKRLIQKGFTSFILLGLVNASPAFAVKDTEDPIYKYLQIYTKVLHLTLTRYVEPTEGKDLVYSSLQGMLSKLDPYSVFLTPEDLAEMKNDTSGTFGGIGIEVTLEDNNIRIITPIEGSPADEAGIMAGDLIIKINDQWVKEMTFTEAVHSLRGKRGSKVKLLIERGKNQVSFDIKRERINQASVRSKLLEDKSLYLRIAQFQKGITQSSRKEIQVYLDKTENPKGIVIDLRNNPGGLLEEAITFSELFIKEGNIVYTVNREGDKKVEKAHSLNTFDLLPMVILTNKGTASASEIVSGAFQDYRVAVLVGEKTFGKGSVQSVIELPDGSGVKLTVAKYYTPEGRSIHEKGIEPDLRVEQIQPDPKIKEPEDNVLKKAQAVLTKIGEAKAKSQKRLPDVVQSLLKKKSL